MRYRILIYISLILGIVSLISTFPADSDEPVIEWQLTPYWPHTRHTNIWPELSEHFKLDHSVRQAAVKKQIRFLSQHQDYMSELTTNATPFIYYVYSQTRKHNMPAEIALIPMVESDYDPFGISRTGATGLWQMMPGTASGLGLKIDWWYDGRRNIIRSTQAALAHLRYLHAYFGDWLLALAAYDCGDGTVRAAIRHNKQRGLPTDFWHLQLPKETKRYVPKLLALAAIIADRKHHGLSLKAIPNSPFFAAIQMEGQIEMSRIAKLANTSVKLIRKLNPAFRRWATAPSGNYWLLLPEKSAIIFRNNLDKLENSTASLHHYKVQSGDTLSRLAHLSHTTVKSIKSANHLNSDMLHIDQTLLIPNASIHGNLLGMKKQNSKIAEDKVPGPKRFTHTVKSHENLNSIAHHYHIKPEQIRYWNQLSYHSKLKPKQQLIIWKKQTRNKNRFQKHKTYHGKRDNQLVIHIVAPGQSLSTIAHYYRVSSHKIIAWNHLNDKKYLQVGEKLKIYLY